MIEYLIATGIIGFLLGVSVTATMLSSCLKRCSYRSEETGKFKERRRIRHLIDEGNTNE